MSVVPTDAVPRATSRWTPISTLRAGDLCIDRPHIMTKPKDGEILGPEELEHAYNEPELSPKEFLLAVMHDHKVPLSARMDAAAKVAVFEHPRLAQVSQDLTAGVTIRIEGGLPALPGTNVIMPDLSGSSVSKTASVKKTNGSGGNGAAS